MSVQRTVKPIARRRAERLVCQYHYSMTLPATEYLFGLYKPPETKLEGVCCFGLGANYIIMKAVQRQNWHFLELIRLVLIHNARNDASYLISHSLQQLPQPTVVVSYADTGWGHAGKIYQATNWLYTGVTKQEEQFELDGQLIHKKSISAKLGTRNFEVVKRHYPDIKKVQSPQKHRYLFPLGNKREKKQMKRWLDHKFGLQEYPDEDTHQYDIQKIHRKKEKNKPKGFFY